MLKLINLVAIITTKLPNPKDYIFNIQYINKFLFKIRRLILPFYIAKCHSIFFCPVSVLSEIKMKSLVAE